MPERQIQLAKYSILLIISIMFISLVSADDWCCVSSPNQTAYCIEFVDDTAAYAAGCDSGSAVNNICAFTECSTLGTCVTNVCDWTTKDNCFGGSFHDLAVLSEVDECIYSCCVLNSDTQPIPIGGYIGDGDFEQYCKDPEVDGTYYAIQCDLVQDLTGTYGSITGSVEDTNGNPLANVEVFAGPYSVVTDSNGNYRLDSQPIGTYIMKAYLVNYQRSTNLVEVTVTSGTISSAATIIMVYDTSALVHLSGKVEDDYSNGIPLATVSVGQFTVLTDSKGYYEMSKPLSEGTHTISAFKIGYSTDSRPVSVQPGGRYSSEDFTLSQTGIESGCNDGVVNGPDEECDTPDDSACPGECDSNCKCPLTCTEMNYYCSDIEYQCSNVNGQTMSTFNDDCDTIYNQGVGGGFCCSDEPTLLPDCRHGETASNADISTTNVVGSGGTLCKCGEYIRDTEDSTVGNYIYCCYNGTDRYFDSAQCDTPGSIEGLVSYNGQPLKDVAVTLSAIYSTVSNDTSGINYRLDSVAPGNYTLTASALGYAYYSANIEITSGQTLTYYIQMSEEPGLDTPLTLSLSAVKGYSHIELTITVSDTSAIEYYEIDRDDGMQFRVNVSDISLVYSFIDTHTIWSTTYTYNVTAYAPAIEIVYDHQSITTGHSACEGVFDTDQFCASAICFLAKTNEYCGLNDISPFTYRLKCSSNNFLMYADTASNSLCADTCIVTGPGTTACNGNDACESLGVPPLFTPYASDSSNIFGLYYDEDYSGETCVETSSGGYKFCYYDYFYSDIFDRTSNYNRFTTVDQCISCSKTGFCYNYQSEDSCLTDSCNYGLNYGTSCAWFDTYPEIGKGICYSNDTTTTDFCETCDVTNPVFYNHNCSQDICSLLGYCYSSTAGMSCTKCSTLSTCSIFDGNQEACHGNSSGYSLVGYPQLSGLVCNSSTIIEKSDDSCGIGFCKYSGSSCIKDANDDNTSDCVGAVDEISCEQDRTVPNTLFTAQNYISQSYKFLSFSVDLSNTNTYYCLSDEGSYCCPSHLISGGNVELPNGNYDYTNLEAKKVLWYFSSSEFGNPEAIMNTTLLIDTKAPQFTISSPVITNSTLGYDLSDITFTVSTHEPSYDCSDSISGVQTGSYLSNSVVDTTETITFAGYPDGTYTYQVSCKDLYGNTNSTSIEIEVDRIKLIDNPQPNWITRTNSTVDLSVWTLDKEYPCYFSMFDPRIEVETRYPTVTYQSGDYKYESVGHDLINSDTYQYQITCYTDVSKSVVADRTSQIFTIDMEPTTSNIWVDDNGVYEAVDPEDYYTNPIIKINCTDTYQGPPREFGCSQIDYCINLGTACTPTAGTTVNNDSYAFSPVVTDSGYYYICVQTQDAGGNTELAYCETMNIDLLPPTVEILLPADYNVIGVPNFDFNGNWNDQLRPSAMYAKIVNENGYQMTVGQLSITGTSGTGTFAGTTTLNRLYAGLNTLTVVAIDQSGNYKTDSVYFYYDVFPPDIDKAEIWGENIADQGATWTIGGGGVENTVIDLEFFEIVVDEVIEDDHEYGYRLLVKLTTNDYQYLDINNMWSNDVAGNVTITEVADPTITYNANLTYNATDNTYYALFTDIFELGNHTVEYFVEDNFANKNDYMHSFYVNDTTEPFFEVQIMDSSGQNVSSLQYGSYTVVITPSEPISELKYLNYTFDSKIKAVQLTQTSGNELRGDLILSTSDLDLLELSNKRATFSILGEDMHGLLGSTITFIKYFYINTAGPLKPEIFTPDISVIPTAYSQDPNYVIEGRVYKDQDEGLRDGTVKMRRNTLEADYSSSSWIEEGTTGTMTNNLHHKWDPQTYGDLITFKDNNTINLHDYNDSFVVGRYIGFDTNPRQNEKLYRIVSKVFTNNDGVKQLYDIVVDPAITGYEGLSSGDQFQEVIHVYDKEAPDGWFNMSVVLDQGNNYFFASGFEGNNEGSYSDIFAIIYDNLVPEIINNSPADGTVTGDTNVPVYVYVDPTGSNVSSYSMFINRQSVPLTLDYDSGYAKISYNYEESLTTGNYSVNFGVADMAGNYKSHNWSFTIDSSAPHDPTITPNSMISDLTPLITITFPQEVILDEVIVEGTSVTYSLNTTSLMNYDGTSYTYQITSANPTFSGEYEVQVKARRKVGEGYGNQGSFTQAFIVDTTPPVITQITDNIQNPYLPVYILLTTDENAICRYGFYDGTYDDLTNGALVETYSTEHTLPVYELMALNTNAYVGCVDMAGNKMTQLEIVNISVDSLLFPAPKIHIPESTTEVVTLNQFNIIGSTFDEIDPLMWVPSVNLILGRSRYFYTNDVEFEQNFYTTSLPLVNITAVDPTGGFSHDQSANAIVVQDASGVFQPGYYVDFSQNRRNNYTLYNIKSVIDIAESMIVDMKMVTFYDELPGNLDTSQTLYVYNQRAPSGWFEYLMPLSEGNNFFYAAAQNSFGEGERTSIYNIVKDTSNPELYDEFPHQGEVIGEEDIEVSVIADGTSSNIESVDFKIDSVPVSAQIQYIEDYESKLFYQTTRNNGIHYVYVKAIDGSGNSASKNWSFEIDASVPERPNIYPNTYINDTQPTIDIQFNDIVSLKSAKLIGLDNGYNKDFTSSVGNLTNDRFVYPSVDNLGQQNMELEYKVEVRASKIGIVSPGTGFWYEKFVVDRRAPDVIDFPEEITTSQIPVEFLMITDEDSMCRFSETDKTYYEMENDLDEDFIEYHFASAQVSSSKTQMYIRCRDVAGNVMDSSIVIGINQDASPIRCGDGVIDGAETCDSNSLGGVSNCADLGYISGSISCIPPGQPNQCQFNLTSCVSRTCQEDLDCDDDMICVDGSCILGCYDDSDCASGKICSSGQCVVDGEEEPTLCGNDVVEPGETCDGNDWGRVSGCSDIPGFVSGILKCNQNNCHFDTELCEKKPVECNNGVIEEGEQCENGVGNKTCESFGLISGTLGCTDCMFDTTGCDGEVGLCDDGVVNIGEQCDTPVYPLSSCSEMNSNFVSGGLGCEDCVLTTDFCEVDYGCNDHIVNPSEECDRSIGTASCRSFDRFIAGPLTCGTDCYFDTSACIMETNPCGNGWLDASNNEACDYNDPSFNLDCTDIDNYLYGEVWCDQECNLQHNCSKDPPPALPSCGNDMIDPELNEQCESSIILRSCHELGYSEADVGSYPSCYSPGTPDECQYNTVPCGTTPLCNNGEIWLCNDINPIWVDGNALCVGNNFDTSTCWSLDTPSINTDFDFEVQSHYIDLSGTVENAKSLEVYVNGVLVGNYTFTNRSQQQFLFEDIYLPESTETGDGMNNVTFIVEGVFPNIVFTDTNLVKVDPVGPLIYIISPVNLMASSDLPTIQINTTKDSTCYINYTSFSTNHVQYFSTVDGYNHSVTLEYPLAKDQNNPVDIVCEDYLGNEASMNVEIFVDTDVPEITYVNLTTPDRYVISETSNSKHVMIYDTLNSTLLVLADSPVRCKYGINTQSYGEMVDYDSLIQVYLTIWESRDIIQEEDESLYIYTICEDEAGLQSDPYELKIEVDQNAPLVITDLNSLWTNEDQPTLWIKTNRLAECKMKFEGTERDMTWQKIDNEHRYSISTSLFDNLELLHDAQYEFEVTCEISGFDSDTISIFITPDLVIPFIDILSPNDQYVSVLSNIDISISTERKSIVGLEINESLRDTQNTTSGSIVFNDVFLVNGHNLIRASVTDKASNTNSTEISVYYSGPQDYPRVTRIAPIDGSVVSRVDEVIAYVWTAYGVNLNLSSGASDIILKDANNDIITTGDKSFSKGDFNDPEGNYTFALQNSLSDGIYTWEIKIVDEFGREGDTINAEFTVNRSAPLIELNSPKQIDSDHGDDGQAYLTNESQLYLSGRILSESLLIQGETTFEWKNEDTGNEDEGELTLTNNNFNETIHLEYLEIENTHLYTFKIYTKNEDGHKAELSFQVIYDLKAPEPIRVNIE